MKNKVQLIAYVDRFSGGNLQELSNLLNNELADIFGGIHILPFFYPIDGADAGFDPINHMIVDPRLGNWDHLAQISHKMDIMADVIVNHVSDKSPQFLDYFEKGEASVFADMFLTMGKVFPKGAKEDDLLTIYRPRPQLPFTVTTLSTGKKVILWTTFTPHQLDIDIFSSQGEAYLHNILELYHKHKISSVRLDAAGYAVKKAGTSCFMLPETFEFIDNFTREAQKRNISVLVEIHSYYKTQIEIAKKVDYVYDFALPPLILHAIYNHTAIYLDSWLQISPKNAITVLDTHDGIGIIDIGPNANDKSQKGILPDEQVIRLVDQVHEATNEESRKTTGAVAGNLDLYQVNTTFYDALWKNDNIYLLARAIQFFSPGIPQVYYMGFLAQTNDYELFEETQIGRNINRTYFTKTEIKETLKRPVVQRLIQLIKFRNDHPAFNGIFTLQLANNHSIEMMWDNDGYKATLHANFDNYDFIIKSKNKNSDWSILKV